MCAPLFTAPEGLLPHSQEPAINSFLKRMNPVHILKPHFFINLITIVGSTALIIIIVVVGSAALGGSWPPQANFASDPYPGQPPSSSYHLVSLRLLVPLPVPLPAYLFVLLHVVAEIHARLHSLEVSLRFHNNIFLRGKVVSLTPNPQPGGPGYLSFF
jgi:hypothetical protein